MGQTTAFFIDEVETIIETEGFNTLDDLKEKLFSEDKEFIWDNMIKGDREVKALLTEALDNNNLINIRARINPKYSAAREGKNKILRYRSNKTGRYIAKDTKNLFI